MRSPPGHPLAVSAASYNKFGKRKDVFNPWGTWDPKDFTVEDLAAGFVRFENGATVVLETSFCANIEKEIFNTALVGTEGGCEYDPVKMFTEQHQTLLDVTPVSLPQVDRFVAEFRAFRDAVVDGAEVPVTGECVTAGYGRYLRVGETGKDRDQWMVASP
jgi:predicted dehydrogenase